jgi:hypothetical protein
MGKLYHILTDKSMSGKIGLENIIKILMNERNMPREGGALKEEEKKLEPPWTFFPLPDGRLIVDNFGDLNDKIDEFGRRFSPAFDIDPETGMTLMEKYLDVVRDEKTGKIIKARIKDEEAYRAFTRKKIEIHQKGSPMAKKIIDGALERLSGESIARRKKAESLVKPEEDMDLGKFQKLLKGLIDEDDWTRDQISGWKLITWKSKKTKEPVFKLIADFYDSETKNFTGTYDDIMGQLNDELDRIEQSFQTSEIV